MATKELDNFVFKFKNLWNAGIEANLSVNTRDGQAWVQLQVGLGRPLDLPQPYHQHEDGYCGARSGTSRHRRRIRREADRERAKQAVPPTAEKNATENDVEQVNDISKKDVSVAEEATNNGDETFRDETHSESENTNVVIDNEAVKNGEQTMAEGTNDEKAENVDENVKAADANETLGNQIDVISEKKDATGGMKEILALAILGNSPNDTFVQDEIESLYRFITSKDHLQRNIKNIKMNYLSTKYIRNSFEHLVEVKLIVNTDQLWESPRNYIWKHLGNDSVWTRGNGTEIRLTRIHQV